MIEVHAFEDGLPMLVPVQADMFVIDRPDGPAPAQDFRRIGYLSLPMDHTFNVRESFEALRELIGEELTVARLEGRS